MVLSKRRARTATGVDLQPAGARVTAWLRDAIVSGRIDSAAPLSEPAVSRLLGVSRVPVREAFRQLVSERLLVVVPRVGTFIAPMTAEDVEEIFEVRRALEVLALRLLPARLSDGDRAALAASINAARRALTRGHVAAAGRLARGFHDLLIETCGNRRLQEIFAALTNQLHWLRAADSPARLRRVYLDHVLIAEAILARRYDDAERRLLAHLDTLRAAQIAQARRRSHIHPQGGRS